MGHQSNLSTVIFLKCIIVQWYDCGFFSTIADFFQIFEKTLFYQVDDPLRCPGDESSSSSPRLRLPPCPVRGCAGAAGPLRIPLRVARDRVRNARQEDTVHVRMSAGGVELPSQEVRCVS